MECCLTETGKICMEKLIDKALAELRHVFCFTSIANEFKEEKVRLEVEIKTLAQHAEVAAGNDKDIEAGYHLWKEKAEKLVQEDILTKQKCFFGLCPNCIWRYKKGKGLANKIEEIKHLLEWGETFENIEISRRLPDVERYSLTDYISFPSRDSKYKELLDALKDDNNYMIVLQGMGGTGKTTLAKEVGKELKKSGNFSDVIYTTVSFTPDAKRIQDDIAGSLGLKWENCKDSDRPRKLWSKLTNAKKILLIMDDVWDGGPPLDFDLIGIPKRDNLKGFRVLITTRSKLISNIMGSDKMIELELLSKEEAWIMFKMYAGIINDSSKSLITTGREIAKKCKQLPVAIAAIASSLRGQQDRKHEWNATLQSLKKPVAMDNVDDEKVGVYNCLRVSYGYLKNKKAKGLFLLSSVFPEDKEIPTEILTRLAIGTGLFGEDNGTYDEARDQVVVAKNKLIDSCLLMEFNKEHVKMHDLVREVAQLIAKKEIQSVNLSNKDQQSSLEKKINIKYLFCKGKDMDLFSCKYDGSKIEILIFEVERDEDLGCMKVPNSFFEIFGKLQVLYFSGHDKRPLSLRDSIHSLKNVRSILVDGIDLGDISVLGNLQSLETLDLVGCKINEFPHEIANLGKLKLLNLDGCEIKSGDPFEVIGRCSTLEELYFIDSFNKSCGEITFPKFKLKRYRISEKWEWSRDSWLLSKCVAFPGHDYFLSKETSKYCMETSDSLQLNGNSIKEGWRNLMPEIVDIHEGMNDLVELRMSEFSQLQCLIDANHLQDTKVLSKLAVLDLDKMKILKVLFKGPLPSDSLMYLKELSIFNCEMLERLSNFELNLCKLKKVVLRKCPMLVHLSSLLTSRNLTLLERLEIVDCEKLRSIIIDERGENELIEEIDNNDNDNKKFVSMFPKLRILVIEGCHQLESILPWLSSQDLPELEHIRIKECHELKYIFRKCQHFEKGSLKHILLWQFPKLKKLFVENCLQLKYIFGHYIDDDDRNYNGVDLDLPALESIHLHNLSGLVYICPKQYRMTIPHLEELLLKECSLDNAIMKLHTWKFAQCLPLQSNIMSNVKEMTLSGFPKIKTMFMLSITSRMLVETLRIENCDELKYIIVDIGDDDNGVNNRVDVFPKLKRLYVLDCKKLQYIFDHYTEGHRHDNEIRLHLPTLQSMELCNLPRLVAMCPKRYCITLSSFKDLKIVKCSQDNKIMQEKEQPTTQQGMKTQQEILGEINTKDKLSQDLSGSMEHCIALKCLFMESEYSSSLQNLTQIIIVGCEKLEIAFSTSIFRCLSQLVYLRIDDCKELKHIIKDDRKTQKLSYITCFPKLKILVVVKCHKLKCVFSVSICKELPELKALIISETDELEEIFKSEGDQKVEIPNLNIVVLVDLQSLLHTQSEQFLTVENRIIQNCPKLNLTSNATPSVMDKINNICFDFKDFRSIKYLYDREPFLRYKWENMVEELFHLFGNFRSKLASLKESEKEQPTSQQGLVIQQYPNGEINTTNKSSKSVEEGAALTNPKTITAPNNLELASSSHELEKEEPTSQQGLKNKHDPLGEINTTIKPSQELEKEQPTSQQGLKNKQDTSGEIDTTSKPCQVAEEGTALTNLQSKTDPIHLELAISSHVNELEKEQPTSQQGLKNNQYAPGEINTIGKPSQSVEEGTALTNLQTKTGSTQLELGSSSHANIVEEGTALTNLQSKTEPIHLEFAISSHVNIVKEGTTLTNLQTKIGSTQLELASSSHANEQDVDLRDTLETTEINDDKGYRGY